MSGARSEAVVLLADKEISSLNEEYVMVIWPGTNDIDKNETNIGLKCIRNFARNCKHTNAIVMTAPHRHNLLEPSCISKKYLIGN